MSARSSEIEAPYTIDIKLRSIGQLFKSLDPSPLVERDLDEAVEDYILDWANDAPRDAPFKLVVHLPSSDGEWIDEEAIMQSVAAYFGYLRDRQTRRIHALLREGWKALAVGLVFLLACTGLGQLVATLQGGGIGATLAEGLLIIGWVANWRPVEIFLYDWRPMRRRLRTYDRLTRLTVEIELEPAS